MASGLNGEIGITGRPHATMRISFHAFSLPDPLRRKDHLRADRQCLREPLDRPERGIPRPAVLNHADRQLRDPAGDRQLPLRHPPSFPYVFQFLHDAFLYISNNASLSICGAIL